MPFKTNHRNKEYVCAYLVVGFNIARVEVGQRFADVTEANDEDNLVEGDLSDDDDFPVDYMSEY